MARTPDEILSDLDAHNADIAFAEHAVLRSLLWEVIEDMLDSLQGYASWEFPDDTPWAVVNQCHSMLTDYVVNHYGDD